MNPTELEKWILNRYPGLVVTESYRERSFFYNPGGLLPRGVYFATLKESDGPNDKASRLNREGVFRISIGIGKEAYTALFGNLPPRPAKGGVVLSDFDFSQLDIWMPHPIYAWMGWIAINQPSPQQQSQLENLLDISYQRAVGQWNKKK